MRAAAFDVNETLLDLRALDPLFKQLFGDAAARAAWFAQVIQSALLHNALNTYAPFGRIAAAAVEMTAQRLGVTLPRDAADEIVTALTALPAFPEVRDALTAARRAGYKTAALTNGTRAIAVAQLTSAGLIDTFDEVISADEVKHLKPAKQVYHLAAKTLRIPPRQLWMVAAHGWDIAGAKRASLRTAFVARRGAAAETLFPTPDLTGHDIADVVQKIVQREWGAPP